MKASKMRYIALLMGGAGGKKYRDAHIKDTTELLNRYPPKMISIITTGIVSGTKLAEMRDNNEFIPLTEREIIEDEIALIESLNVANSVYFYGHHQNNIARVSGHLKNKEKLIEEFKNKIKYYEENKPEILDITISREYL